MLMPWASRDAQRAPCAGRAALPGQPLGRRQPAALRAQTWTGDNAYQLGDPALEHPHGPGAQASRRASPTSATTSAVSLTRRRRTPNSSSAGSRPRSSCRASRIHSWNADGTVNAPWMHPDATPLVRDLIRLREQLIPYLYDPAWRHHRDGEPIQRPTFFDFPDDPAAFQDCDELLLGPALLVSLRRRAGRDGAPRATACRRAPARLLDRRGPRRAAARSSCPAPSAGRRSWCAKTRRSRSTSPRKASTRARGPARLRHLRRRRTAFRSALL